MRRRTAIKKKIYCFILVVSMLLPLLPVKVSATDFIYVIGAKTGTIDGADTDDKDISTIKMTGVEIISGLTEKDIVYTPGEKAIRFKNNGSVAMKFVDEYGNEGVEIITVSNICTNPPAVSAKATLAEDLLSINVTFEKMLDEDGVPVDPYRELSDLYVTYAGITYKLEGASFTLKSNGNYEFYVHDDSGATQKILLNVTGIDDKAPVIKEVRWEYKYHEEKENGIWEEKTISRNLVIGQDTSGTESGYVIAADANNPETNQNVNVTVVTNKETTFVGGKDDYALEKTMEYTIYDGAGNGTTVRRTIRLVGFYDTVALINGKMPDSTNVATVSGNRIEISLKNFSGISYARYEKGIFTKGQMKTKGTSLKEKNGVYTIENASEGWYTIYIQTDKRDYFNILVHVAKSR